MKQSCIKAKTKRGNFYNTRTTKLANGISQMMADRRNRPLNDEKDKILLALSVRGTTDKLSSQYLYFKIINKEHPVDKGYFKKVVVLSDFGKNKLKRMKKNS